ncbi:MAG: hypothetical protein J6M14_01305 [Campylobacter sp.]|nr:hypothetical protein [Campylobacter sp.]
MDNEKIMREKAEQMTKKAEMKIQQAKEKETKYQQWLENKKQTDPNFRDYDKEPLIIQSYEEFFVLILFMGSLILSIILSYFCKELYKGYTIYASEYISGFVFLCLYVIVISIFQKTHFSKHKIKFTNRYIEFYDYGKLKRQCEIIENKMFRTFSDRFSNGFGFANILLFLLFIVLIIATNGFIFLITIFFYISNLIIKLLFYIFINKSFKGFSMFPFISVADERFTAHGYGAVFSSRYFLVYLYSYEIYKEVKKYFLQQGINIDNLPKKYSVI